MATNYPASRPGSERHTLSVLVENRPGVLARIAGLFARRAFNINSLSVSPTERPDISRVTVTADVEAVPLEQIIKQLNKLLHVLKIVDLDPATTVERELVLIKVAADESNRSDVLEIVRLFRVRVVDVHPESLTIEATGAGGQIVGSVGRVGGGVEGGGGRAAHGSHEAPHDEADHDGRGGRVLLAPRVHQAAQRAEHEHERAEHLVEEVVDLLVIRVGGAEGAQDRLGVLGEDAGHDLDPVGLEHAVGVDAAQHVAGRRVQPEIARGDEPLFGVLMQQPDRRLGMSLHEPLNRAGGVVGGPVVDDDHLMGHDGLTDRVGQAVSYPVLFIPGRNDDRNVQHAYSIHFRGYRRRRAGGTIE